MAYRQILYHIVFRTKYSQNSIKQEFAEELYKYIWGVVKNKNCKLFQINGVENHIHILSDLHPSVALANFVKDIKVSSSLWMKESKLFPDFNGWASGYCAVTHSYRDKEMLIKYIKNQQEHHKKTTFRKEVEELFKEFALGENTDWFFKD